MLATKVSDTAAALTPLAPLIRDDTTVLCLQNGLGSEDIARTAIGKRGLVLRGITQFGAIFVRPGVIKFMIARHTLIERHPRSQQIAEVFTAAGLDGRISDNIRADVWQKLIFNCLVNPIMPSSEPKLARWRIETRSFKAIAYRRVSRSRSRGRYFLRAGLPIDR